MATVDADAASTPDRARPGLGVRLYLAVLAPAAQFLVIPVIASFVALERQEALRRFQPSWGTALLLIALLVLFAVATYAVVALAESSRHSGGPGTRASLVLGLVVGLVLGSLAWWFVTEIREYLDTALVLWVAAATTYVVAAARSAAR